MRWMFLAVVAAVLASGVGCGYTDAKPVDDTDVSGTVTGPDGKPIQGVNVYFQPASQGAQPAGFKLGADGSFSGKIKVGTYTYYLVPVSEGDTRGESIIKGLPDNYKKPDDNRTVRVSGGKVDLKW